MAMTCSTCSTHFMPWWLYKHEPMNPPTPLCSTQAAIAVNITWKCIKKKKSSLHKITGEGRRAPCLTEPLVLTARGAEHSWVHSHHFHLTQHQRDWAEALGQKQRGVPRPAPCRTWGGGSTRRRGPPGCWRVSRSRSGPAARAGCCCSAWPGRPGRCPGEALSPAAPGLLLPQGAGSSAPCSCQSRRPHR